MRPLPLVIATLAAACLPAAVPPRSHAAADPSPVSSPARASSVIGRVADLAESDNALDVEVVGESGKAETVRVVKTPDTRLVKVKDDGSDTPAVHSDFEVGSQVRATGVRSGSTLTADELRLLARPVAGN